MDNVNWIVHEYNSSEEPSSTSLTHQQPLVVRLFKLRASSNESNYHHESIRPFHAFKSRLDRAKYLREVFKLQLVQIASQRHENHT